MATARDIIDFWQQAGPAKWFNGGEAFDRACEAQCKAAHHRAARRELEHWLADADGGLALLILLDQIPRNIYRGSAHAYATDALALHYADRFIAAGLDAAVDPELRCFAYLPFEHSEAAADQTRAVALFTELADEGYLRYAIAHQDVITRFGRFPHRNQALGRISTAEEQTWLDAGGGF